MPVRTWIKTGETCYVLGQDLGLLKGCWYTCKILELQYVPAVKEINLFGEEQILAKPYGVATLRIARTATDLDGTPKEFSWEQTINIDKLKREPY